MPVVLEGHVELPGSVHFSVPHSWTGFHFVAAYRTAVFTEIMIKTGNGYANPCKYISDSMTFLGLQSGDTFARARGRW
jgi:hypothetical protein